MAYVSYMPVTKRAMVKDILEEGVTVKANWESIQGVKLPSGGQTIVDRLVSKLNRGEAKEYKLSWNNYSGLMRHVINSKEKKLDAKLLDYKGAGKERIYTVAIRRVK